MYVYIDEREKSRVHTAFKKGLRRATYKRETLPIGDIVVGNFVIERKTLNDLYDSVIDGRLFNQLRSFIQFKEENENATLILLIEHGRLSKHNKQYVYMFPLNMIILNIMQEFNTLVYYSNSLTSTIKFINDCVQYGIKGNIIKRVRGHKRQKTLYDEKMFFLMGLPSVGLKTANEVIKGHQTVMDYLLLQRKKKNKISKILYTENKK